MYVTHKFDILVLIIVFIVLLISIDSVSLKG